MGTVAAQFTSTGPLVPSYADILQQFKAAVWSLYGSDVILDANTQDGQFLAVLAQAQSDSNQLALSVYLSYAPTTAQGPSLSSAVKINGLRRNTSSASVATVLITGTANTVINNGIVGDNQNLGTQWNLPSVVTIPLGGSISVIATCSQQGAITAGANTLTQILTPVAGWQTVNNAAPATAGQAIETDAALRQRQSNSVSITASGPTTAVAAAVANVSGVSRSFVYENQSDVTDVNGLISHSIAVVTQGGLSADIANAIANKKPGGTGTNGTTSVTVIDPRGVPNVVKYYVLSLVTITVNVTIKTLTGFVATTSSLISQAIAYYISQLPIGQTVYLDRVMAVANLKGTEAMAATGLTQAQLDALAATFNVTINLLKLARSPAAPAVQDVAINFNEAATASTANITVVQT